MCLVSFLSFITIPPRVPCECVEVQELCILAATCCKETHMDVAVPETSDHPSRESLLCNHTEGA